MRKGWIILLALFIFSACSQEGRFSIDKTENEAVENSEVSEIAETAEEAFPPKNNGEDRLLIEKFENATVETPEIAEIDETDEETLPLVNDSVEAGRFKNATFGISFKYPEDWTLTEENFRYDKGLIAWFQLSNYTLQPWEWPGLHEGEIRLSFSYYETDQGLEEFFQEKDVFIEANTKKHIEFWSQFIEPQSLEDYNGKTGSKMINGHKFMTSSGQILKKEEGSPSKERGYYFKKDKRIFVVHASTIIAEGDETLLDMADEIINSIEFDE